MIYPVHYDPTPRYGLAGDLMLEIRNEGEFIIFTDLFINNEYKAGVVDLVESQPKGPVQIVDLGANVGYFTWYVSAAMFSHKIPFEATLVEAHPVVYNELMRRLSDNPQIPATAYCGLVGGQSSGRGSLVDNGNHHTLSRLPTKAEVPEGHYVTSPHMKVQYLDLMRLLPDHIDLLKVDIEGAEFALIEHFPKILQRTDRLLIEIHHVMAEGSLWDIQLRASGLEHVNTFLNGEVSTQFWKRSTMELDDAEKPTNAPSSSSSSTEAGG